MNNLFFGHKDDKLLFEKDRLTLTNNDVEIVSYASYNNKKGI